MPASPMAPRTKVPEIEESKKPRAVLTDAELGALVAHPDVDAELKLLVLLSWTIGGMRTGGSTGSARRGAQEGLQAELRSAWS
jgi:hypothetical protein